MQAQDATVDWADAGLSSLTPFTSGTTVQGSDSTTATVTWSTQVVGTESFVPAFGGAFVSYFSGNIGSSVSPLLLSFDNATYDPRDKVTVTIVLSRGVTNLRFALSDIDNGNFADAIELGWDDDLAGGFNNAANTTGFWTAGSAVTRTNNTTVNGWRGTANSGNGTTAGDLQFNFGNQQVRRIQVTYFSYTGTGDPGTQFATISDLAFSQARADLSLTKQLIGNTPPQGGTATWRLTVTSASTSQINANGVIVRDTFPAGFVFQEAIGTGSFNAANGQWSVGTLAPGASASIDITGEITAAAGSTVTNIAEIIASSALDPDSTPNNAVTTEDDYASASFTVPDFSRTVPQLSCPAGQSVFDWDSPSISWTGGSLNNAYAFANYGQIQFAITGNAVFAARANFGGAVPALTTAVSGGLSPAQRALAYNLDNTSTSQQAVTTITLPRVFTGVQFSIFDIDSSGTFQDRITAYGLLNGQRVNAVLTGSAQNTVNGDTILGTGGAADTSAIANGTITFLTAIDTIVFEYGNGPTAPSNPTNQSIALHDITVCVPLTPNVSVTKVSSIISDPVNGATNPKAIPGALIEYLISVANTGNGATDLGSVVVLDNGPAEAKLCLINRTGGPIVFTDPGGSGLTYNFVSIGSDADNLQFSSDFGVTWTYVPVADGQGCDANVTAFRVRPGGGLAAGGSFTLRARYIIQ
ncbi:MAG: DUF11 domain-containing protein [Erythrobacter sp.]|nr:DUF11 domain-containing protein [Erythrobacter sp.]